MWSLNSQPREYESQAPPTKPARSPRLNFSPSIKGEGILKAVEVVPSQDQAWPQGWVLECALVHWVRAGAQAALPVTAWRRWHRLFSGKKFLLVQVRST